jgi:hypothetical protein
MISNGEAFADEPESQVRKNSAGEFQPLFPEWIFSRRMIGTPQTGVARSSPFDSNQVGDGKMVVEGLFDAALGVACQGMNF